MCDNRRYQNAKLYRLEDINGYFYIGSTTSPLYKRLYEHKNNAKKQPDRRLYKHFNSVGWDNVRIILEEEHFLDNKEQLLRAENILIKMYKDDDKCLNSRRSYVTKEEKKQYDKRYREANKDKIKEYYEVNKPVIKEQQKEYYENNKDHILETVNQYREANKQIISERKKIYREVNKERLQEKRKETYTCVCGSISTISHSKRHERTKKHINYINGLNQTAETI